MIISTPKGSNHLAPDASYLSSKPVSSQVDYQINSWTFLNYVTTSTTWIDFMVDFAYNRKDDCAQEGAFPTFLTSDPHLPQLPAIETHSTMIGLRATTQLPPAW